ncbi:MAG: DUF4349 domain-containing protein [Rhodococcus sp.]|nr:DUF4349 domain-containing protein [Rhodococcus sp. (in: high G+C Gram-positive bacteria)]
MGKHVRRVGVLTGAALLGLVLAGCSGNDGGLSDSAPQPAPPGISAESEAAFGRQAPDQTAPQRQEIVTGSVSMTAENPIDVGQRIVAKVEAERGRVDDITERPETEDQEPSASLTVRVPAATLTETLDELRDFGEVTSVSVSRSDVTMQVQDIDARIGALTASIDRLQDLIAEATTTADLIEAETALSDRQGELDSLQARKRSLDDQIELATLSIDITTDETDGPGDAGSFWDGIVSGWNALLSVLAGTIVVIGAVIPWLLFVGVIAAIVLGAYRLLRRRKNKNR